MKKIALLVSALLVVAGVASAFQEPASQAPASQAPAAEKATAADKTHTVEAEVVSTDATAKTLTIKGEAGNKTVPVEAAAITSLSDVKAGDKVKLTCRDNDKGEHQAVTKIEKSSKMQ
jgi:hypothetical protein